MTHLRDARNRTHTYARNISHACEYQHWTVDRPVRKWFGTVDTMACWQIFFPARSGTSVTHGEASLIAGYRVARTDLSASPCCFFFIYFFIFTSRGIEYRPEEKVRNYLPSSDKNLITCEIRRAFPAIRTNCRKETLGSAVTLMWTF